MATETPTKVAPLPFFTDQLGHKAEAVVPMLHPFLVGPELGGSGPNTDRFDRYFASARQLFTQADRAAADIAVFPWDWNRLRDHPALLRPARRFIRENAEAGLRTLVFSVSDPEIVRQEPHTILFRTSLLAGKLRPDEHAMPGWALHAGEYSGENLPLRRFEPKPAVGFCGASYRNSFREPNWFRRAFRPGRCQYERVFPQKPGLRGHIIDRLRSAPGLQANILERDGFFGGAVRQGRWDVTAHVLTRQEYVENLLSSDYALCVRGGGNFSFRLYEALQLGRVPLFINTDCVLPWPDYIPWRKLCVWVELAEVDRLEEILLSCHARLGPGGFEDRQRECRAVWEKYLSPPGFFGTLRTWLQEKGHCRKREKA